MNSKDSNLLSGIMNEGLTCSTCLLSNFSLPSKCWLTIMVTKTCIIKVWTCKGIISKHVPPLSGLIGLITSYTIDGIVGTLLVVPISTYTKFEGL
jgi:hypothetical protein